MTEPQEPPANQPMFNAPPATVALCLLMVGGYVFTSLFGWGDGAATFLVFDAGAFRAQFGPSGGISAPVLISLIGHAFVHSGFGHFGANTLFLLAFGSAVERALGARMMVSIFLVSAIAGALALAVLVGDTPARMVGASGGVHGVAGAVALIMLRRGQGAARRTGAGLLAFLIIVNLLLGLVGGGQALLGFQIGWEAHLGGLVAGLAMARWRLGRPTA